MPDKKMNVISQIIYALQRKKTANDDIVKTADRVIEEYIFNKNRLIHESCRKKQKGDAMLTFFMLLSAAGAVVTLLILL